MFKGLIPTDSSIVSPNNVISYMYPVSVTHKRNKIVSVASSHDTSILQPDFVMYSRVTADAKKGTHHMIEN
jgi:hypothetical protein